MNQSWQMKVIIKLVDENPNDMQLGEAVRNYIRWQNDLIERAKKRSE